MSDSLNYDIPVASLSEDEQLSLAVKASNDTKREKQAARVASFIYDRLAGIYVSLCRFLVF